MDRIAFDLKVRAALGLWSLADEPFCRATLFNFLKRLRDFMVRTGQDKFQALFDRLSQDALERFGLKGAVQRCDSTQIGSNLRQYTRVELLVEVVLRMWRVLGEADQAAHAERFAAYVSAKTSGQFVYRLRRGDIDTALEELGRLYAWMVEALEAGYGSTEIYHVVRRVFTEHFTRVDETVAVRAATEVGSDSLQSPDDPEATYRKKDGEGFHGYVLHASETAEPENALQLITDVTVEPNNEEDNRILHDRLPEMQRKTPELRELHHDGAYGSEENDRREAELGIAAVQSAICGYSAQAPMRIDGDGEAGPYHVTCAAGHTVPGQLARVHFKAEFLAACCAGCPLASVCPARELRRDAGRTFYFTKADVLRQARHRRLQTLPEERRTIRANVEATIKQFKAPCRNGKLRTRGLWAARRYGFLRGIGINFGRIHRHLRRLAPVSRGPAASPGSPASLICPQAGLSGLRAGLRSLLGAFMSHSARLFPTAAAFA